MTTHLHIEALVKSEGSKYAVRLFDQHGIELPAFVYNNSFMDNAQQAMQKCLAVASFINSLSTEAKNDLYQHLTR